MVIKSNSIFTGTIASYNINSGNSEGTRETKDAIENTNHKKIPAISFPFISSIICMHDSLIVGDKDG